MLVLSRKKGEAILIGDDIELTVLEVEGETIKLGIKAPRDVRIFRKEIYSAIGQANREAVAGPVDAGMLKNLLRNLNKDKD
ncbi:carbon storage regulator CsrA [Paenibacillus thermoaerophilus]|uniref:Translational regulator CsrA n=1 Tax=Paenibacillus thermoaerophilus TaxID=1215385 RepID=A0ABW2V4X8_9BACL|nr:carbon storage regulator CsrA [Paenibacillus thermoaerophilus]TMV12526.1 carbon storage regulator CsrA [Paenibacillus thermoaerophilus]